jgi:hypothetical protein
VLIVIPIDDDSKLAAACSITQRHESGRPGTGQLEKGMGRDMKLAVEFAKSFVVKGPL